MTAAWTTHSGRAGAAAAVADPVGVPGVEDQAEAAGAVDERLFVGDVRERRDDFDAANRFALAVAAAPAGPRAAEPKTDSP